MIELKYSFEYFCSPIWTKKNQDADYVFENVSIDTLKISDNLKKEINELDVIYQATYNDDYPPEPIVLSKDEDLLFKKRVIKSLEQLSEELFVSHKILIDKKEEEDRPGFIG